LGNAKTHAETNRGGFINFYKYAMPTAWWYSRILMFQPQVLNRRHPSAMGFIPL